MKATIIACPVGFLAFGEHDKILDKTLFTRDPRLIADKLNAVEAGQPPKELLSLMRRLKKKGYDTFAFEDTAIADAVEKRLNVETCVLKPSPQGKTMREDLGKFAVDIGFVEKSDDFRELVRAVSLELTRLRVKKAGEKRDLLVTQAILSIDDLDKTANLFMGRIREWYGLHFPELDRLMEKHETLARLVSNLGKRQNFTVDNLQQEGLPGDRAAKIAEEAEASMGADLAEVDIEQVQSLCRQALALYDLRQALQGYADSTVDEVAPNLQALVGSMLAARLIALAGGLANLAKMPASTIQVLGAEKALFRALKTGTRPPKHGIIFQDTLVHEAKKWQRGKMSRALAGKLAIAARTDAFSTRYIGDSLKADLMKRAEEIKRKFRKPPPPKERKPKRRTGRKKRRGNRGRRR
jgi:nucleolar protein 56